MLDAEPVRGLQGASVKFELRSLARRADYFNLQPIHTATNSRAKRFSAGLLRSKSSGEALRRGALAQAVLLLLLREDAIEKAIPEAGNALMDAVDFSDVNSTADDHNSRACAKRMEEGAVGRPCFRFRNHLN